MTEMGGNVEGKKGKATRHVWRFVLAKAPFSMARQPCPGRIELEIKLNTIHQNHCGDVFDQNCFII